MVTAVPVPAASGDWAPPEPVFLPAELEVLAVPEHYRLQRADGDLAANTSLRARTETFLLLPHGSGTQPLLRASYTPFSTRQVTPDPPIPAPRSPRGCRDPASITVCSRRCPPRAPRRRRAGLSVPCPWRAPCPRTSPLPASSSTCGVPTGCRGSGSPPGSGTCPASPSMPTTVAGWRGAPAACRLVLPTGAAGPPFGSPPFL